MPLPTAVYARKHLCSSTASTKQLCRNGKYYYHTLEPYMTLTLFTLHFTEKVLDKDRSWPPLE